MFTVALLLWFFATAAAADGRDSSLTEEMACFADMPDKQAMGNLLVAQHRPLPTIDNKKSATEWDNKHVGQTLRPVDKNENYLQKTEQGGDNAGSVKHRRCCNVSLSPPQHLFTVPRHWEVPLNISSVCRMQHGNQHWSPEERNWCWVAAKAQCNRLKRLKQPWMDVFALAKHSSAVPASTPAYAPLEVPELCDSARLGESQRWTSSEVTDSSTWFAENVAVYVLNLPQDIERWDRISARLTVLNIAASHVNGVDLRATETLLAAKKAGLVPEHFSLEAVEASAALPRQNFRGVVGTAGAAVAHLSAYARAISDNMPLTLVLEDDALLTDDFMPRLRRLVTAELPCDWEVTSLSTSCPFGRCVSQHLMRLQPDINEPAERCRIGVNFGAWGMLYRTERLPEVRRMLSSAIFDTARPGCLNIDVALASISDQVAYYAVPAVQLPGCLSCCLQHDRRQGSRRRICSSSKSSQPLQGSRMHQHQSKRHAATLWL